MALLVTFARYQSITGDTTSTEAAVSARIEQATQALEDELDRPLEQDERTETLHPTRDGWLWPRATPLLSVDGDYEIDGDGIRGALPWPATPFTGQTDPVTFTYTGGFLEPTANSDSPYRLPYYMERDLAWAAYRLGHVSTPSVAPVGASSITVGDVSVGYGTGGAPAVTDALDGAWSRRTRAWHYRPIGGPP